MVEMVEEGDEMSEDFLNLFPFVGEFVIIFGW